MTQIGPTEIIFFSVVFIILLSVGLYSYYFIRSMISKDAPYVGSFDSQLRLMQQKLKLKKNSTLIDLGCGDGKALRSFARDHHIRRCIGYDINLFAVLRGRLLNLIHRQHNIRLHHQDFSKAQLGQADYIYLYLFPVQMRQLEKTIKKEKKPDCVIVANTFQFANRTPYETITDGREKIYLYR